ncbi:MAG: glycosyltransferase family 2 protein [Acidobacteriota bacterium]
MSICALIPAYNEAETIGSVVRGALDHVSSVLVVDDGSNDGTAEAAEAAGATCLLQVSNQGKGAAVRRGLAHLCDCAFSHVLFMDADGQHRPDEIPSLVKTALQTGADIVIGARNFDKRLMPAERHFSNSVGSKLASRLAGTTVKDSQCGFRLVSLEKLRPLKLRSRKYEIEMEILLKLCRSGATVAHAPVSLVYDGGKARSKMNPVRDTVRICFWSLFFRYFGL